LSNCYQEQGGSDSQLRSGIQSNTRKEQKKKNKAKRTAQLKLCQKQGKKKMARNHTEGNRETTTRREGNHFSVLFQNVQKIMESAFSERSRGGINTIRKSDADVFTMAEPWFYWPKLDIEDKWWLEGIISKVGAHRSWLGCKGTEPAHTTSMSQYGGVGLVAMDEAVGRARECDKDPTRLGGWVWMHFQGRNGHIIRVVTIYCPCKFKNK
jgi:hypothetical protein